MVVRLRLLRFRYKPFYFMAVDRRTPRDGKILEVLGYYNPLPGQDGVKRMGVQFDRVNHLYNSVEQLLFNTVKVALKNKKDKKAILGILNSKKGLLESKGKTKKDE